jgi:hypothetical protein
MVRVFQGGGEHLILASIVFEAQGLCLECAIEARADFVGFRILVEDGRFFSALGVCALKFSCSLPIVPISRRFAQIPFGDSRSSSTSHTRLRRMVTTVSTCSWRVTGGCAPPMPLHQNESLAVRRCRAGVATRWEFGPGEGPDRRRRAGSLHAAYQIQRKSLHPAQWCGPPRLSSPTCLLRHPLPCP